MEKHTEIVRLLLADERIDINKTDDSDMEFDQPNSSDLASNRPHMRSRRRSYIRQPGQRSKRDSVAESDQLRGDTPLDWAISVEHLEIVRLLLAHKKIDVNKSGSVGMTPLDCAAILCPCPDILQTLLAHPDIVACSKTILHGAVKFGSLENIQMLLESSVVDVNAVNERGESPLTSAFELFSMRSDIAELIQLFINNERVNLHFENKDGQTVRMLVDKGLWSRVGSQCMWNYVKAEEELMAQKQQLVQSMIEDETARRQREAFMLMCRAWQSGLPTVIASVISKYV
eukprot:921886_1